MLIVFGGLPGTGKTTIARHLAAHLTAVYIRIDTIEQALMGTGGMKEGTEGYAVAYAIAEDNVRMGNAVVADSVNPLPVTRQAWKDIAARHGIRIVEIEVVCSDEIEHRRRIETREPDIEGHKMPTWEEVVKREYRGWPGTDCTIDTSKQSIEDGIAMIMQKL